MRCLPYLAALALSALLTACQDKATVWIESPGTATNLTFGLAQTRSDSTTAVSDLTDFAVRSCYREGESPDVYWEIESRVHPAVIPTRVRYGSNPTGFTTWVKPQPLDPGCYEVTVKGESVSASARFTVAADGRITELSRT